MQKKIARSQRATDSHVNGEGENKYATKIAMLESQVRATDSHVNGEEENKYAKKIAMLESQEKN